MCSIKRSEMWDGHWRFVLAGSRFLQDAETRYSPLEGELLAIVFGMNQCRMFLSVCPNFYVATDHLPLIPILGDKALDQIQNPRLRALKEKTLRFNFQAIHVPGKKHMAPDATSRYPGGQVMDGMVLQVGEDESTDQMAKDRLSGIVGRAVAVQHFLVHPTGHLGGVRKGMKCWRRQAWWEP